MLLSAPCAYTVSARLLSGPDGTRLELRARREEDGELQEYVRHVNLRTLDRQATAALARDFTREARAALLQENSAFKRTLARTRVRGVGS